MQISFLNRYLYSPIIWLHRVNSSTKINMIFVFLFIVNYINTRYINSLIVLSILVLTNVVLSKQDKIKLFKMLLTMLIPISFSNLANRRLLDFDEHNHTQIYIPFIINFSYCKQYMKNTKIRNINILYYYSWLPNFIIRIYILGILNFLYLQSLFITTLYENIILYIINCYKVTDLSKNKTFNILIIIACSSQFLEEIINYLYKLFISFRINNYSINTYYKITLYSVINVINFIKKSTYNISAIVHTRINVNIYNLDF
uniref:Ycf92 n=1 Tax=Pterocladia lucida TaxID=31408 RepID=A0A6M3WVZ8_PTELU|nr:hypothetical protein [Pterocladia lucida]